MVRLGVVRVAENASEFGLPDRCRLRGEEEREDYGQAARPCRNGLGALAGITATSAQYARATLAQSGFPPASKASR